MKTKTIKQSVFIKASPKEVYEAFMDSKKHAEFTGGKAKISNKVEGEFSAWDGYIQGKNIELKEGEKIVQEWQTTEWPEGYPPSIVEFSFKKEKNGTKLIMVHSKVPAEQADSYKQGWIDYYWEPLKKYYS